MGLWSRSGLQGWVEAWETCIFLHRKELELKPPTEVSCFLVYSANIFQSRQFECRCVFYWRHEVGPSSWQAKWVLTSFSMSKRWKSWDILGWHQGQLDHEFTSLYRAWGATIPSSVWRGRDSSNGVKSPDQLDSMGIIRVKTTLAQPISRYCSNVQWTFNSHTYTPRPFM